MIGDSSVLASVKFDNALHLKQLKTKAVVFDVDISVKTNVSAQNF